MSHSMIICECVGALDLCGGIGTGCRICYGNGRIRPGLLKPLISVKWSGRHPRRLCYLFLE